MDHLSGLPFRMLAFDKDGDCLTRKDPLFPDGTTDLLVLSHGWKNDEDDARALYAGFVEGMLAAAGPVLPVRRFAVVGISWPSFRFRSDLTLLPDDFVDPDMGGAADAGAATDLSRAELEKYAAEVAAELGIPNIGAFVGNARAAAKGSEAADALTKQLRDAVRPAGGHAAERKEHAPLFKTPGGDLVEELVPPPPLPSPPVGDNDGGDAAGLGSAVGGTFKRWLTGGRAGVARLFNQFTYYEMKARAGTVGKALAGILDARCPAEVRIHLIGHSFGARLVTAAAKELKQRKVASLTLLQAAFSHNAFSAAKPIGAFRGVIAAGKVDGPIIVTHTHNDTAVGFFYAVASLASGEVAAGVALSRILGGPGDSHGGLGANGAQRLVAAEVFQLTGALGVVPDAGKGRVTNVLADSFIKNHNDVGAANAGPIIWAAVRGT